MIFSRTGLLAVSLAALAVSGCQSSRMAPWEGQQPAPLAAAPSGQVTSGALPPPAAPGAVDPSQFPPAPGADTQMAGLPPAAETSANAPELTAGSVAGVWNATVAGQSCRVATPQTKFGQGYRAGPLRCPAPIDSVKSWSVSGKQLTLYDENGSTLARLYSSGAERFDGQTETGIPISLSR